MSNYLVGSTVGVRLYVRDPLTDELTDATVTLTVQAPDGTETTPSPTHTSTGVYDYFLTLDEEGWWSVVWEATVGSYTSLKECTVCAVDTVLAVTS